MPRTRYLASLLGQESILVLFYSIKYSVVEKITDFFTYRIVFFISLINDIQIRYFIFVVTIFVLQNILCLWSNKINESIKFIFYKKRNIIFERSKLSRENISRRINVRIARAKLMTRLWNTMNFKQFKFEFEWNILAEKNKVESKSNENLDYVSVHIQISWKYKVPLDNSSEINYGSIES